MTDREQTRRDAEEVITHGSFVHEDLPVEVAQHCLALLAELEQAERKIAALEEADRIIEYGTTPPTVNRLDEWIERAEQAERERDEARENIKWQLRFGTEQVRAERDEALARLAKVPALVERYRKFAEKVLACDSYGCENGPNKCLHADAKRELDALTVWEQE